MKFLLLLAFACTIEFTHALMCHNCLYYPGKFSNSKDDCKNNPKDTDMMFCPLASALNETQNGQEFFGILYDDGSNITSMQSKTMTCGQGYSSDYVIRGCVLANANDIDRCTKNYQWRVATTTGPVYLPIGKTCLCDSDLCNYGNTLLGSAGLKFMIFGIFSLLYAM